MKKIVKVLSLLVAPLVLIGAFISGCKRGKPVDVDTGDTMQGVDEKPAQAAAYEKYSKQAIEEYKAVAAQHMVDGEVDIQNAEVVKAACAAAAKLYAYACYNERTLDQYVWFSDKEAGTDLGKTYGWANVTKQDYYLRINESDKTCGYRYYYTYKYAKDYDGLVGTFKSAFEAARLRVTVDTDLMYRFEGENMRMGGYNEAYSCNMVEGDWKTKADEWGVKDLPMVKEDFIAPEDIANDIIKQADDYDNDIISSTTIHGNINILAENIIKYAMIAEEEDESGYLIVMNIDTDVANKDKASVKMLTKENGTSGDCNWQGRVDPEEPNATGLAEDTGMKIMFRIWDNGLFRFYAIQERWTGKIDVKIMGIEGTADSTINVTYSYSDEDCDMTKYLAMLEEAKKAMSSKE